MYTITLILILVATFLLLRLSYKVFAAQAPQLNYVEPRSFKYKFLFRFILFMSLFLYLCEYLQ